MPAVTVHAAPHAEPAARRARTPASPRVGGPAVQRLAGNRAMSAGVRVQACGCGGTCASCAAKQEEQVQPSLSVGPADDVYEREAERTADQVMRMAAPADSGGAAGPNGGGAGESAAPPSIQRIAGGAAYGMRMDAPLPMSGGRPLSSATRGFMEPRLGADFGSVRVHEGADAQRAAAGIGARAFTHGGNVWLGRGESEGDRRLMAHELTHVVQQGGGAAGGTVQRQPTPTPPAPAAPPAGPAAAAGPYTLHPSCAAHADIVRAAWAEGTRLTRETIATLRTVEGMNTRPGGANRIAPGLAQLIQNAFGEVTGMDGGEPGDVVFTNLPEVIRRYGRIADGFAGGKTVRCDPQTVGPNACGSFEAFVNPGNTTDIFLCAPFYRGTGAERDTNRGATLLHEMAHSQLGAGHLGMGDTELPSMSFDCGAPMGFSFRDSLRNAYAYDNLANCLHGVRARSASAPNPAQAPAATPATPAPARPGDRRFSLGVGIGPRLLNDTRMLATMITGTVSLRTGEFVVVNPIIGINLVYVPSLAGADTGHMGTVALGAGVRIQQPLRGVYFDVLGGGYAGFEADPGSRTRAVGGVEGTLGLGYRWNRIELGAAATGQLPLENLPAVDRGTLLILGRGAVRF